MKYCRVCKVRAGDTATTCKQCGGPLSTFGTVRAADGGGVQTAAAPAVLALQGQIRQLETTHRRIVRRSWLLALLCSLCFLLLLLVLYMVYDYTVLSYAILRDVQIEQNPAQEAEILISFEVVKPGKVAFDRRSGRNRTEKFDVISRKGPVRFTWTWSSDPATGIDFQVVSRGGWTRETVSKHFHLRRAE